jgi:RNA polymerase sigma factor (sigma-70 family)
MAEQAMDRVERLFVSQGPALVRRARAVMRSEADAEDAVQEAMLSLLRAPHVLGGVERLAGWIFTVVRRRCADIARSDSRRRSAEAEAEEQVGVEDLFDVDDPAALMERDEVADAVAEVVEGLPGELRFAFMGNALDGRTFRELAEESGVPAGTLMARKKRAVDRIRHELERRKLLP